MAWELTTGDKAAQPVAAEAATTTFIERLWRAFGVDDARAGVRRQNSAAFTMALVSLSAKLAKSDGVALRVESEAFERLHTIVHEERGNIRRMFDMAAQDAAGFDAYAREVARLLRHDGELLHDVLEGLFHIAVADGILHPEEERYLEIAADAFAFDTTRFRTMRGLFVHDPDDPYTMLGLSSDVDNAALKLRYRQLVREHHPDQLIARGAPVEFVRFATAKLAEINGAYDRIAKERGL